MPFYTGLTGVWLYFRKTTLPLQPAGMNFAGGHRVTLESDGQRDLFPNNTPSRFRLRLPDQSEEPLAKRDTIEGVLGS